MEGWRDGYLAGRREGKGVYVLAFVMADGGVVFEHVAHHKPLIGFGEDFAGFDGCEELLLVIERV